MPKIKTRTQALKSAAAKTYARMTKKKKKKKAKMKAKAKRIPNQKGTGRVTAQGQRIEELTGFKQKRFGK